MTTDTTDRTLVTILVVGLAAIVLLALVFMRFGFFGVGHMGGGTWDHGMWGDGGPGSWLVVVGILFQFLFLAALVVAGYLVYRGVTRSSQSTDRALEELRVAYARGELSEQEYENRREKLEREG